MVATYGDPHPLGPVGSGPRGGIVRYLNQGAEFVRKARRDDAYRRMHEHCRGRYRIVSEGPEKGGEAVVAPLGDTWIAATTEYWSIKFECLEEGK